MPADALLLPLRLCALPPDLLGEAGRPRSRSSYVYLSGELWTEELVLSANTSVFTGLKERCDGNGGGPPWSELVRPMRSELGES